MSLTASRLISAFVEVNHGIQLDKEKHQFLEFKKMIKERRKQIVGQDKLSFNQSIELAEKFKSMDTHKITLSELQTRLDTSLSNGLTNANAARLLEHNGPNKLTQKQGVHWTIKLFHQFTSPFALLIWLGAVLCFIAFGLSPTDSSNLYLGIVLVVVNLITGLTTFYQNMKSEAIMEGFKDFIPQTTIVLRDNEWKKLEAKDLVVGDVINIQTGVKIPADVRIISCQNMKVDNSSLTGETQLLPRSSQFTDDNPLQTKNIAFFSTLNKQGTGKGVVIATGDNTFIGQIANLAASATSQQSPLKKQIKRFIIYLTIFAVAIGIILFCLGFIIKYPAILNFIFAIGIITANVPEGMIVQVTVGLALTAKRLQKKKVLCKKLDAVETLGSTSCICSDKTGTLTLNKMTAAHLWYSGKTVKATNLQRKDITNVQYDYKQKGFITLQQNAVVCSVANFDRSVPNKQLQQINNNKQLKEHEKEEKLMDLKLKWEQKLKSMPLQDIPTHGDASESALIKFYQPIESIVSLRNKFPIVQDFQGKQCRLPFNSLNKYAYCIAHYNTPNSHFCMFTKGAPQRIWALCTSVDVNGEPVLIDYQWINKFKAANQAFGRNGQRVLGFSKCHLPKDKYPPNYKFNLQKELPQFRQQSFTGVLSLIDPPRQSVPFAVLKCRSAGIKVIMVTGDQPVTAASIAKQCNIINTTTVNQLAERQGKKFDEMFNQSQAIVIHGDELTRMALEDQGLPQNDQGKKLEKWLKKSQIVFARTSPAQKLIIVKACQKLDEIVAVTGDGVNDSPAIKKADIGISMGITGTDVAKDAADMILLDDDFSSIVVGVEEGRKLFDNLKKAICYALTSQIGQMLPFIGFIILQFPLPVTTVIILYISIGTDLIPAISFAYEPGELDIMTRKPRSKEQHLVSMTLMSQAYGFMGWTEFWGALFCYYVVANDFGFPPSQLQFKANISIVIPQPGDIYNPTLKNFGNSNLNQNASCSQMNTEMVDWIYTAHATVDLRMAAVQCVEGSTSEFRQAIEWGECFVQQISPMTNLPACYTTEGIKYAQSAYFYGMIICQIFNTLVCKTRIMSLLTQGISNPLMLFAITTQIMLIFAAGYFQPFNIAFGIRDNIYIHFGVAAIPFAILMIMISELRKFLIRSMKPDANGKSHWFERAALW